MRREDIRDWGQFTTAKINSAALLSRALRAEQTIYCSPLVDPYQPAEEKARLMPEILETLTAKPPRAFVLQTRGPLILRDLDLLQALSKRTVLRVSFSITTNRESVRRRYEPRCVPIADRWETVRELRVAGIDTYVTLAPLLPCDPEELVAEAAAASDNDLIGDPLHIRAVKTRGATTREAAFRIAAVHGDEAWFEAGFQQDLVDQMAAAAARRGRRFATGPAGFRRLAEVN